MSTKTKREVPEAFLFEKPDIKDKDGKWLDMRANITGKNMGKAVTFYRFAQLFYELPVCKDIADTLEVISIGTTEKAIGGRKEAVQVLEHVLEEKKPRVVYESEQEEPTT